MWWSIWLLTHLINFFKIYSFLGVEKRHNKYTSEEVKNRKCKRHQCDVCDANFPRKCPSQTAANLWKQLQGLFTWNNVWGSLHQVQPNWNHDTKLFTHSLILEIWNVTFVTTFLNSMSFWVSTKLHTTEWNFEMWLLWQRFWIQF